MKYFQFLLICTVCWDVLKHASDAGDAGDAGYLLKTYNQPCNSLLMSALYETMNSDAGKY